MTTRLILVLTLYLSSELASAQNCFPGNRWINCLLNTCTIYKKCPGDPSATCTIKRTECGCEANWFKPTGEVAQCDVRQNLRLCPGGETVVRCNVDLCAWPCNQPGFLNAPCRQNRCGQCSAEYYVKDSWAACPTNTQKGPDAAVSLPISPDVGVPSDPASCNFVPCNIKICINKKCPLEPRAVCRPDGCNECKPAWYYNDIPVRCYKETPLVPSKVFPEVGSHVCPAGQSAVVCDQTICDMKQCRNYPNANCRPDGCGQCRDTWFVGDTQVDCLSDECPPDVPFVKCQDDPCKYFSHYCPDAVCRASQCGSCEAKFYANGVEIECAMPPKACPAEVKPKNCKWFTCPANICPSNKRLMCRIDPCGPTCSHDWVDIYNGEVMTCRTFDGDGRTIKEKSSKIYLTDPLSSFFTAHGASKDSSLHGTNKPVPNKVYPEPQHPISVITGSGSAITGSLGQNVPEMNTKLDVVVSRGPGRFRVDPLFMQPRQVSSKTDLFALLSAYEHELMGISSLSIQNALRNQKNLDGPYPLPDIPLSPVAPLIQVKPEPIIAETEKRGLALPGVMRKQKVTSSLKIENQLPVQVQLPVVDKTPVLPEFIGPVPNPDTPIPVDIMMQTLNSGVDPNPNNLDIPGQFMHEQLAMEKAKALAIEAAMPPGVSAKALEMTASMPVPVERVSGPLGTQDLSVGISTKPRLGDVGMKSEFQTDLVQGQDPFGILTSVPDMSGAIAPPLDNTPAMFDLSGGGIGTVGSVLDQPVGGMGTVGSVLDPSGQMMVGPLGGIEAPINNPDQQGASLEIVNTNPGQLSIMQQALGGPGSLNPAQSQSEALIQASGQLGNLNPALVELRTLYPELDPFGTFGNMLSVPGNTNAKSGGQTMEQQIAVDIGSFDLGSPLFGSGPMIGQNELAHPALSVSPANEKIAKPQMVDTASLPIASDPVIGQNQFMQLANEKATKTQPLGQGLLEASPVKGKKGLPISMDMFPQWGVN